MFNQYIKSCGIQRIISMVFLLLCIAASVSAEVPMDPISGDVVGNILEESDDDEFGEFDEFDEFDEQDILEINDPLIAYNRLMTRFNDTLLIWVIKPLAVGYGFIVREPIQLSISNFFNNLGFPVRFVNNLLQLKYKPAAVEFARFGINTSLGFLGFFDPARSCMGLFPGPEDFGQTLGYYGVGRGFHLVLPLLGPSNLRDVFGKIPDYFLDPIFYLNAAEVRMGMNGLKMVNTTALHVDKYEALKSDALDLYILLRNAYEIKRLEEIEE